MSARTTASGRRSGSTRSSGADGRRRTARGPDGGRRAGRAACPLTPEMLLDGPSGDLFGWTQNAGHGVGPAGARAPAVPDPLDPGRHPRAGRPARSRSAITRATGRSGS